MAPSPVKIDAYLAYLRDNLPAPAKAWASANTLTKAEARDVFVWLLAWGEFQIANRDTLFSADTSGKVVPPAVGKKVTISPSKIAGIDFRYVTGFTKTGVTLTDQTLSNVDMRNVIFLYWLCEELKRFDVKTLYHIGFVFPASRTDCHGQGRALDFAGVAGDGFEITVAHNWSGQPIAMPMAWQGHKKGAKLANWPAGFTDTYFRLDPARNPYLDQGKQPALAARIFECVYDTAAAHCKDVDSGLHTSIGSASAYILHPDYKKSNTATAKDGREAHWQHIHTQIGPTGSE